MPDQTEKRAPAIGDNVPVIDTLEVRVIVDNTHMALVPDKPLGEAYLERFRFPLEDPEPGRTLQSEFGLSLLLTSYRGDEVRNILLDFGYSHHTMRTNADILDFQPEKIDAMVLSHGHFDHYGGLKGFLETYGDRLPDNTPFFVGGEECFCGRYAMITGKMLNFGELKREIIEDAGLDVVIAEAPTEIAGHAFSTGQIGLTSFEQLFAPSKMVIANGDGSFPLPSPPDPKLLEDDTFSHEIGLCYNIEGKGLVVITMCGHRGVVNTVRRAKAISGEHKVHAVMGGFHLMPHPIDYINQTAQNLVAEGVEHVFPMHCSGADFLEIAKKLFPGKAEAIYTGTRITLGEGVEKKSLIAPIPVAKLPA